MKKFTISPQTRRRLVIALGVFFVCRGLIAWAQMASSGSDTFDAYPILGQSIVKVSDPHRQLAIVIACTGVLLLLRWRLGRFLAAAYFCFPTWASLFFCIPAWVMIINPAAPASLHWGRAALATISFVINVAILWFLLDPATKQLFQRSPAPAESANPESKD